MGIQKKKPTRTCMGCNLQKEKNELLRIVRTEDGKIIPDLSGKINGRGAYVCKNEDCLDKVIKTKRLEKVFERTISDEVYQEIREVIIDK